LDISTDSYRSFVTENTSTTSAKGTTAIHDQYYGTSDAMLENVTENDISPEYKKLFDDIIFVTDKIIPPFIITIGLVGNILSFVVLRKTKYTKQSTCVYLRALTLIDSILLLVYSLQRYLLRLFPDVFWANGDIFCKEFIFVAYGSLSNCHWTLVFMTVDRFIAVAFPIKCATLCSTSRSKKCLASMTIITLLFHLQQFLRKADPEGNVLIGKCPFDYAIVTPAYELIFQDIFVILVFYIPLFSLIILNALIIYNVRKRGKETDRLCLSASTQSDSFSRHRRGQERQITVMLLLVTTVFTIAVTPFTLDHLVWGVFKPHLENDPYHRELRHVLYEIALTCVMINPAINFYLYCLGCHKFRDDLKSIFGFKNQIQSQVSNSKSRKYSGLENNIANQGPDSTTSADTVETDCNGISTRL
jgi:hypothetical protein